MLFKNFSNHGYSIDVTGTGTSLTGFYKYNSSLFNDKNLTKNLHKKALRNTYRFSFCEISFNFAKVSFQQNFEN
jgi:hypothetical protein